MTASIIAIFLTAPLGAILTENLGRKLLHKSEEKEAAKDSNKVDIEPQVDKESQRESNSRGQHSSKKSTSSEEGSNEQQSNYKDSQQELKLPDIHEHRRNQMRIQEEDQVHESEIQSQSSQQD